MKLIAASILAALLPMGALHAQKIHVGFGIRIGVPSTRVVVTRKIPRVHAHRDRMAPRARIVRPAPRGHWIVQRYRHWVPAIYGYRRDACGHRVRHLVRAGHFENRLKRVWVPAQRQEHRVQPQSQRRHRAKPHQQRGHRAQPEPVQRHRVQPESVPGQRVPSKAKGGRGTRVGVLYS
jgi:hypothetical protein